MLDEQEPEKGPWGQEPGRTVHWLERVLPGLVIALVLGLLALGVLYLAMGG